MPDIDSLGVSGRALWDGVNASRQMTNSHIPVLYNACRIADNLDSISTALLHAPMTVENSRGDEVSHPLFTEHRQQSLALARLLGSLGIDKLETKPEEGSKSIYEQVRDAVAEMNK